MRLASSCGEMSNRAQPGVDVRNIGLDEIQRLNAVDMSYASPYGYALSVDAEPSSGGERTWKFTFVPRAYDPPFERIYDWDWREVDEFADRVRAGLVWAAFDGERVIGLLELRESSWNNSIWIQSLYVDVNRRRQGIGTLLLDVAEAEATRRGARAIFVEAQVSNGPAMDFYLKHGFRLCGFNDHLYSNSDVEHDEVAVFLVREIAPRGEPSERRR